MAQFICAEQRHVTVGNENFSFSADGLLMPSHKGRTPEPEVVSCSGEERIRPCA